MTEPGHVFIIGAGPGDPGLISARGIRLLSRADVVIYDRAVSEVLRWARPDAERIEAGAPAEGAVQQDAISMLVAEKAREGLTVAHLKWGDAFVFDSGAKEALFLHEQGVPFEVVPGIPAAIGAAAYAGVPLTYPGAGDAIVMLRGHEGETDAAPDVDWEAVTRIDGTIVCYASGRQIPSILRALIDAGAEHDRNAALIYRGTHPDQHTVTGTIAELLAVTQSSKDLGAALLVVGEVACLREHLRWFDERPLFGKRIVVTRSRELALELVDALENLGAQAIQAPTLKLAPADDPEAIDRAAASVDDYEWVIFESATAVSRLISALANGPRDLRALGDVKICAIGPSTAERLVALGLKPDVIVPEFRVESVGDALTAHGSLADQQVLIVRPDHLRDVLAAELVAKGARVTDLVAYRTVPESADSAVVQNLYRMLLDGQIDAVTFTSPTSLELFAALIGKEQAVDLLNTTIVAAIGPVTAAAAAELGIKTTIVPDVYTVGGLIKALVRQLSTKDVEAGSLDPAIRRD